MGIAAALGHAIHLQHIQAQALIPSQQRLGNRRGTGQRNPQCIQSEAGEHLAAYALADKRQPQQGAQALFRDFAVNTQLEFGPDTRHTKQRCRPRPAQIRQKGIQALGEKYRLPGVD